MTTYHNFVLAAVVVASMAAIVAVTPNPAMGSVTSQELVILHQVGPSGEDIPRKHTIMRVYSPPAGADDFILLGVAERRLNPAFSDARSARIDRQGKVVVKGRSFPTKKAAQEYALTGNDTGSGRFKIKGKFQGNVAYFDADFHQPSGPEHVVVEKIIFKRQPDLMIGDEVKLRLRFMVADMSDCDWVLAEPVCSLSDLQALWQAVVDTHKLPSASDLSGDFTFQLSFHKEARQLGGGEFRIFVFSRTGIQVDSRFISASATDDDDNIVTLYAEVWHRRLNEAVLEMDRLHSNR